MVVGVVLIKVLFFANCGVPSFTTILMHMWAIITVWEFMCAWICVLYA
jgi:hypothetical protein